MKKVKVILALIIIAMAVIIGAKLIKGVQAYADNLAKQSNTAYALMNGEV